MAKIHKIKNKANETIYPATIPEAVIDPADNKNMLQKLALKAAHGYVEGDTVKTLKEVETIKASHGYSLSPKTLKQVDDSKAAHGYVGEETVKTLKEVDEAVSQLTSETKLANAEQSSQIKDIENVLSTANINQATTLSVMGRKTISLPKNASKGGMQAKLEGLTAENLVANGDFRNGTTGWNSSYSVTVENKILTVSNVSGAVPSIISGTGFVRSNTSGNKYYIKFRHRVLKQVSFTARLQSADASYLQPVKTIAAVSGVINEWVNTSLIATVSSALPLSLSLYSNTSETGGVFQIDGNYGIFSIDLTKLFGPGNEITDVPTLDAMFDDYFEGKKNFTPTGRVRSVGRNLFDKRKAIDGSAIVSGLITPNNPTFSTSPFIAVKPGLTYYGTNMRGYGLRDSKGDLISFDGGITSRAVTIPNGVAYIVFGMLLANKDTVKFELGSAGTPYEPYRETNLYLTAPELKSNGEVKDEIRKGSDGYELVKRVGVGSLGSELIAVEADRTFSSDTGFWNKNAGAIINDGVASVSNAASISAGISKSTFLTLNKAYRHGFGIKALSSGGIRTYIGLEASVDYLSLGSKATMLVCKGDTNLRMYGTIAGQSFEIDDVSLKEIIPQDGAILSTSAFTELSDGTILYTLATPQITPISYGGVLNSAESGTVYHEPVVADAGVYGTNLPILLTDYPIASIEEIIKHENGIDTYLNVAIAVIAGDGLSFTHPDLASGDLVLLTYSFSKESTNGNITATFFDSNVVKIDTVTGKAYKITDVVTNGVLTRTLTEV